MAWRSLTYYGGLKEALLKMKHFNRDLQAERTPYAKIRSLEEPDSLRGRWQESRGRGRVTQDEAELQAESDLAGPCKLGESHNRVLTNTSFHA